MSLKCIKIKIKLKVVVGDKKTKLKKIEKNEGRK